MGLLNELGGAIKDAATGAEKSVEELGKGAIKAEQHAWHGVVDGVKTASHAVEHAATDAGQGVSNAAKDISTAAHQGHLLTGLAKARQDVAAGGGRALDDVWQGASKSVGQVASGEKAAIKDAGGAIGKAYDKGLDGVARGVGDVAGKQAGDAIRTTGEKIAEPVRQGAGFAFGAATGIADGAGSMVHGIGDLVVGGVRVSSDSEYRDKLIKKAETVATSLGHLAHQAIENPQAAGHAIEKAAIDGFHKLEKSGEAAAKNGTFGEWAGHGLGEGGFNIVTSGLVPEAKVAQLAGGLGKAAEMLNGAGKLAHLSEDAGKAGELANDASKLGVAERSTAAGAKAGEAAKAAPEFEAADVALNGRKSARQANAEARGPATEKPAEGAPPPTAEGGAGAKPPKPPAETTSAAPGEPEEGPSGDGHPAGGVDRAAEPEALPLVNVLEEPEVKPVWQQPLAPIGPNQVHKIVNSPTPFTAAERSQQPIVADLLTAESKPIEVSGRKYTTNIYPGQKGIPEIAHDAHNHDIPFSGTYDPNYKDGDLERLADLSEDGKQLTLNFPVAPHIFELGGSLPKGGTGQEPRYYLGRIVDPEKGPQNVIGHIRVEPDKVTIMGPGVFDTVGKPLFTPGEYDRAEFEKLLPYPIPKGVEELHFVSSPSHTTLGYRGLSVDKKHIDLIAEQGAREVQVLGRSPTIERQLIGFAGNNPFDPKGYTIPYQAMAYANAREAELGLTGANHLNISGFGELTIAKESVGALSAMPELTEQSIQDISQSVSAMRYAGGTTIIHMDASNSGILQGIAPNINALETAGRAENVNKLKMLLKANPDQDFIWAHVGAAITQTVPSDYRNTIRDLLDEFPNLKIDTSWTATADMMSGRTLGRSQPVDFKNVDEWGKLIADYPDRFLWGSDNIAASRNPTTDKMSEVLTKFRDIGLLRSIEDHGSPGALKQFMSGNFEDTIKASADRVTEFRKKKANQEWLKNGGPTMSKPGGMIPPYQQVKGENGKYKLVKSENIKTPLGGNRETYLMPEGVQQAGGPAMIYTANGGTFSRDAGPGRARTEFPLNPDREHWKAWATMPE